MNNKCVYVHKLNGEVVYVGSGVKRRSLDKSSRRVEHLLLWESLDIEVLQENLSSDSSRELEQQLIEKYLPTGKLLNFHNKVAKPYAMTFLTLDKVLEYDTSSKSFLRWKSPRKNLTGKEAGYLKDGYFVVRISGMGMQASRIVWVLNNQIDIDKNLVVDHIDGNPINNSIENLRLVPQSDNMRNKRHRKSSTGFQCITENLNRKQFATSYSVHGKQFTLYFNYCSTRKPRVPERNFTTREQALEAALAYRNSLVEQGLIVLTNKDELNGIN
jgi:hypothetical protein